MDFLINQTKPAILDRFYMGELTYAPVKRGAFGLNKWQLRNIEMLLAMRNPLCIYCFTDVDNTRKNFEKDKEEYALQADIVPLMKFYNKATTKSRFEWIRYDYRKDPDYKLIDKIIIKWWKQTYQYLEQLKSLIPPRTLGNFFADTLIYGDISNIALEQPKYRNINVGFANGPSAELLYGSIPDIKKVALSNIKKAHIPGRYNMYLKEELSLPKLKKVICLGNNAYNNLVEVWDKLPNRPKIKIIKAYHPAYILRGNISAEIYKNELTRLLS